MKRLEDLCYYIFRKFIWENNLSNFKISKLTNIDFHTLVSMNKRERNISLETLVKFIVFMRDYIKPKRLDEKYFYKYVIEVLLKLDKKLSISLITIKRILQGKEIRFNTRVKIICDCIRLLKSNNKIYNIILAFLLYNKRCDVYLNIIKSHKLIKLILIVLNNKFNISSYEIGKTECINLMSLYNIKKDTYPRLKSTLKIINYVIIVIRDYYKLSLFIIDIIIFYMLDNENKKYHNITTATSIRYVNYINKQYDIEKILLFEEMHISSATYYTNYSMYDF